MALLSDTYMTGATSGAGTTYSFRSTEFTPGFKWGSCQSIFRFLCMFGRSLFVPLYLFSFGHCVVCSSIYEFWLPLWYLQLSLNSMLRHRNPLVVVMSRIKLSTALVFIYLIVRWLRLNFTVKYLGTSKNQRA